MVRDSTKASSSGWFSVTSVSVMWRFLTVQEVFTPKQVLSWRERLSTKCNRSSALNNDLQALVIYFSFYLTLHHVKLLNLKLSHGVSSYIHLLLLAALKPWTGAQHTVVVFVLGVYRPSSVTPKLSSKSAVCTSQRCSARFECNLAVKPFSPSFICMFWYAVL